MEEEKDKLYVKTYADYYEIRCWALVYFPELLYYFLNHDLTFYEHEKTRKDYVREMRTEIEKNYKRLGKFKSTEEAVTNLIKYYKRIHHYDCPKEQAEKETITSIERYQRLQYDGDKGLDSIVAFPVLIMTPDLMRKLKWICPIKCVREYLKEHKQLNPRWEKFYKLFWKGKNHHET